jgi:PPOX class probable F420-dependent enzyme
MEPGDNPWQQHPWAREAVAQARHAILGTVGPSGEARLVPCAFALMGDDVVSAVDHKPKTSTQLARLADIERTGRATVLVEHYEDDWDRLWWVRLSGRARLVTPADAGPALAALVARYEQYTRQPPEGPCYAITVERVAAWRATEVVGCN